MPSNQKDILNLLKAKICSLTSSRRKRANPSNTYSGKSLLIWCILCFQRTITMQRRSSELQSHAKNLKVQDPRSFPNQRTLVHRFVHYNDSSSKKSGRAARMYSTLLAGWDPKNDLYKCFSNEQRNKYLINSVDGFHEFSSFFMLEAQCDTDGQIIFPRFTKYQD